MSDTGTIVPSYDLASRSLTVYSAGLMSPWPSSVDQVTRIPRPRQAPPDVDYEDVDW